MSSSSVVLEVKDEGLGSHTREDNEHARLVAPNDTRTDNVNSLEPLSLHRTNRSFSKWMKILVGCLLGILLTLIFIKWGVPFAFEKVWSGPNYLYWTNLLL